jgi:hypothetical protein
MASFCILQGLVMVRIAEPRNRERFILHQSIAGFESAICAKMAIALASLATQSGQHRACGADRRGHSGREHASGVSGP